MSEQRCDGAMLGTRADSQFVRQRSSGWEMGFTIKEDTPISQTKKS